MKKKHEMDNLTNEKLVKKFDNLFDLVNYAISCAEQRVRSGKEPGLYADIQNTATLVLQDISEGKAQEFVKVVEVKSTFQKAV